MDNANKDEAPQPGSNVGGKNNEPRSKQQTRRRNRNRAKKNENQNQTTSAQDKKPSFKWYYPRVNRSMQWWHVALMEFVAKSPEHHAKLEQEMREFGKIKIVRNCIVVTAVTSRVEDGWQVECEKRLEEYFKDYNAQQVRVEKFDSTKYGNSSTRLSTPLLNKQIVVVAGVSKDVAKMIYELNGSNEETQRASISRPSNSPPSDKEKLETKKATTSNRAKSNDKKNPQEAKTQSAQISNDKKKPSTKPKKSASRRSSVSSEHSVSSNHGMNSHRRARNERPRRVYNSPRHHYQQDNSDYHHEPHQVPPSRAGAPYINPGYNYNQATPRHPPPLMPMNNTPIHEMPHVTLVPISPGPEQSINPQPYVPYHPYPDQGYSPQHQPYNTSHYSHSIYQQQYQELPQVYSDPPIYLSIAPQHQERISRQFLEEIETNHLVTVNWTAGLNLSITGEGKEQAKLCIIDEIHKMKFRTIPCSAWLHDQLKSSISRVQYEFSEVEITYGNSLLKIVGHPIEVKLVQDQLIKEMENYDELVLSVPKELHRIIIGTGGQNIKKIKEKHQVFILVPNSKSPSEGVLINGRKEQAQHAMTDIKALLNEYGFGDGRSSQSGSRNPHTGGIGRGNTRKTSNKEASSSNIGKPLSKEEVIPDPDPVISRSFEADNWLHYYIKTHVPEWKMKWPKVKIEFAENCVNLDGPSKDVELWMKDVEDKVTELANTHLREFFAVPRELRKNILGQSGNNVKDLEKKYQVVIQISNKDSETLEIEVHGQKEGVNAAKNEILKIVELVENSARKTVTIQNWMKQHLHIEDGSTSITHFQRLFHKVKIDLARNEIIITGKNTEVDEAFVAIQTSIEELALLQRKICIPMSVNQMLGIIGHRHEKLNKLREDFQVKLHYESDPVELYIEGPCENVEKAHVHVVEQIQNLTDYTIAEVPVAREYFGKIIGKGGMTLKGLILNYEVEDINVPKRGDTRSNVQVMGRRMTVDRLINGHLRSFIEPGRVVRYRNNLPRQRHRNNQKQQRYGSEQNLYSRTPSEAGSLASMNDFDDGFDVNHNDASSTRGAVLFEYGDVNPIVMEFVFQIKSHLKKLKGHLNEETDSLVLSDQKIKLASQVENETGLVFEMRLKSIFDNFFDAYDYQIMEFHPKSSVNRWDMLDENLVIKWDDDGQVQIWGLKERVQEKVTEYEIIQNRTKRVEMRWKLNNKYIIRFIKQSSLELDMLKQIMADHGSLELRDNKVIVVGEILEINCEDDWKKQCEMKLSKSFKRYHVEKIAVPPLLTGRMRINTETQLDVIVAWDNSTSSLVIYGIKSSVDRKVLFLKNALDNAQNTKKKVSTLWRCEREKVDIFNFVKESSQQMENFVRVLGEYGSPVLEDNNVVTIHSEILEISSTQDWERECKSIIVNYFDNFIVEIIHVEENLRKYARFLTRNDSSVYTRWDEDNSRFIVCGIKNDVRLTVEILPLQLRQMESEDRTIPQNQPVAQEVQCGDGLPQDEAISISLDLSKNELKCIEALESSTEFNQIDMTFQDDCVLLSGKRGNINKAKRFIQSLFVDVIEILKYGAFEFLTDSTHQLMLKLHVMQKMSCNCNIMYEQIQDSKYGDKNFICIPSMSDVKESRKSKYGNLRVKVREGDITQDTSDMIVNTTVKSFSFSGPLSQTVLRNGGQSIKTEAANNILESDIRISAGWNLKCKKVLHVAIPLSGESMKDLVFRILKHADHLQMESIALPSIGAGGGGWRSTDVAAGFHDGISHFVNSYPNPSYLRQVKVVLFPDVSPGDKKPFYDRLKSSSISPQMLSSNQNRSRPTPPPVQKRSLISTLFNMFSSRSTAQPQDTSPTPANLSQKSGPISPDSKTDNDDSKKDEASTVDTKTSTSGFVKILLSSKDKENMDEAKKEITKFVNLHLKELTVNNSAVLRLTKSHLEKMEKIASEQKVRIVVNRESSLHKITIQGTSENANAAMSEIQKIISSISIDVPVTWTAMGENQNSCRVKLHPSSAEYQEIETMFYDANRRSSYIQFNIISIVRVQNLSYWRQYTAKKNEITARATTTPIERRLFHGTSYDTVDIICRDGFDRSFSGKNATVYGEGVYFSTESSYSHSYTSAAGDRTRQMFLAHVLTGDYCRGRHSYVAPPLNPSTNELFDSVVDSMSSPTMFVVFRDANAYPSYIIKYTG